MKNNKKLPLQIALHGMDDRTCKTMTMYFKGPCKQAAEVVGADEAEIDLVDADYFRAKEILEERKIKNPERPIILLSLQEINIEGTFFVKKPVQLDKLLDVFKQLNELLKSKKDVPKMQEVQQPVVHNEDKATAGVVRKSPEVSKHIDENERKKVSKHRTAMDLTEGAFSTYIGFIPGIDFSDTAQVMSASYHSKNYFLGYVLSAFVVSKEKNRIVQLNSSWKQLIIFPHSREVWLDADDKQLRAFAGLTIKNNADKGMSLSPIDPKDTHCSEKMECFYDMDAFIWKLAIWTSKGRYPDSLDITRPVFLKHWPNFTRLIVTPHALRIAALMVEEPRSMLNIAEVLNIKPQYVFVFVSAVHSLGLVGQAHRQVDTIVEPENIKPAKSKGLLGRILGRLRG